MATQVSGGKSCSMGTKNCRHPFQCPRSSIIQMRLKMRMNIPATLRNCRRTRTTHNKPEIAQHASCWMTTKCRTPHFQFFTGILSRIRVHRIQCRDYSPRRNNIHRVTLHRLLITGEQFPGWTIQWPDYSPGSVSPGDYSSVISYRNIFVLACVLTCHL